MSKENDAYHKGADGKPVSLEPQRVEDGRRFSPSVGRNRDIVRDVFVAHMPACGRILEIGSGTGEHGIYITEALRKLQWTFSDADPVSLSSVKAWMAEAGRAELDSVLELDASASDWGAGAEGRSFDGMYCANVIHISPLEVAKGLFAGADRTLAPAGRIFLYGPFGRDGVMADGNARFDLDLKRRDARWGVRDLEREILPMAERAGFRAADIVEMPANNLSVVFDRL